MFSSLVSLDSHINRIVDPPQPQHAFSIPPGHRELPGLSDVMREVLLALPASKEVLHVSPNSEYGIFGLLVARGGGDGMEEEPKAAGERIRAFLARVPVGVLESHAV